MHADRETPEQLITTGSELAGAAVAGALGFLASGPLGAAAAAAGGAALSNLARNLLTDWASKRLSSREEIRVGAVAAYALERISSHLEQGATPRDDGFFEGEPGQRSSAEEIFDGVLQKSKNEHEERKLKYAGILYANLAFVPGISKGESNLYVQLMSGLTYRQLAILALFEKREREGAPAMRNANYHDVPEGFTFETFSILQEVFRLGNLGLVAHTPPGSPGYVVLLGWSSVVPDHMVVTPYGKRFHTLSGLDELPQDELDRLANALR